LNWHDRALADRTKYIRDLSKSSSIRENSGFFGATASAALAATSFFIVNSSGGQAEKRQRLHACALNIDSKIPFVNRPAQFSENYFDGGSLPLASDQAVA